MQKALYNKEECIILELNHESMSLIRFKSEDGTFNDPEKDYYVETYLIAPINEGEQHA